MYTVNVMYTHKTLKIFGINKKEINGFWRIIYNIFTAFNYALRKNFFFQRFVHNILTKQTQMKVRIFFLPHLPAYMPLVMRLIFHDTAVGVGVVSQKQ